MKTKKLLKKIRALLSADRRAQLVKYDSLEEVLKKLKKKEAGLLEKLEKEDDKKERREIARKLDVIEAQRKKGMKLMKEIGKNR